mmetsp:Transcript_41938/g.50820  ORF Transcript_41938/g.50820 Transcript_41938/m.50820 type:complete len:215 (-) Transcript_41938:865-1509(-)|eukprot:CAMPEP_0197846340 /NCGR_PEP_ID=MMETSP1438-20131217/3098_1 /TAXON_ID=1461541 /ORGANISM="Pterosperma sp., Strain CCMP1384" /LENGTH=214 /DNA_ID=CAMNT_0043457945 /DNA_START=78 /DNA_END=722 /DNA_ORIENTATION=+
MVFYFTPNSQKGHIIFMGRDKYENEDLIKYGVPEDVWFHVDKLSSAHVYIRLNVGETLDDIEPETLEDCAQLVKANSIQGNKKDNLNIVYTMWANLRKEASMEVGQVSFHVKNEVKNIKVATRKNEIVNRLNKTKDERYPNLQEEREEYDKARKAERVEFAREQKQQELELARERKKEAELRSYDSIMNEDGMRTNAELREKYEDFNDYEDDFM